MSRLLKAKTQHLIRKDDCLFLVQTNDNSCQSTSASCFLPNGIFTKIKWYFFWNDTVEQHTSYSCIFHCTSDLCRNTSFENQMFQQVQTTNTKSSPKRSVNALTASTNNVDSKLSIVLIVDRTRNENIYTEMYLAPPKPSSFTGGSL